MASGIKKLEQLKKMQQFYEEQKENKSFNLLVYGGSGSGKTHFLSTCRRPVFVDSFDPGGVVTLRKWIESGDVVVDTRWESEDPFSPKSYRRWAVEFDSRVRSGFFEMFGTYALDSLTTFAQAIMYDILLKEKRQGKQPYQQDYLPQMTLIENHLKTIVSLPCDFVALGHEDTLKDEFSGKTEKSVLLTGKLSIRVPLLFDEMYYLEPKDGKGGKYEPQILTRSSGGIKARTRLGAGGILEKYEPANLKVLLKKVGLSAEDKPKLSTYLEEEVDEKGEK